MKNFIKILVLAGLLLSVKASAIDNGTENSNGQSTAVNTKQSMANTEVKVSVNVDMIQRFNDYKIDTEYITLWDVLRGTNMDQVRDLVAAYYTHYNESTEISNQLASNPY